MRNRIEPSLELGWLLVAVLTPLWVNLWGLHLFDFSKAALLRSLVWAMAGLWLASRLLGSRFTSPQAQADRRLLGAVGLLALTLLLTTATAFDWRRSLFGSVDRAQGLLTQLSQIFLFLLVATRLHTLPQARRLVHGLAATAGSMALLALVQAGGWDPLRLVSDARSNLYATLGRANFVGAYLAMLAPLLLSQLILASGWRRALFGLVALASLLVTGLTQARAAWLATGVGLGLFALLAHWPWLRPRARRGWIASGLLALLLGLAALFWAGRTGGSIAARLAIWQAVLELIGQRPWLGSGPDSLGLLFPQVFPPQLVYYQGRQLFVDRAHNLLLDWLVAGGGLLAASWLLVYALYFRRIAQALAGPLGREPRLLLAAGAAGVGANLAGNLASFDVVATATASWLLMGLTVGLTWESGSRAEGWAPGRGAASRPVPAARLLGVAGVGLVALLLILHLNLRPLLADGMWLRAQRQAAAGEWSAALIAGERARVLWPFIPEASQALGDLYRQRALAQEDGSPARPQADLERAQEAYRTALALRPADFVTWMAQGETHALQALAGDRSQISSFQAAFQQAASLAPNHARLYVRWGEIQMALADSQETLEAAAETLQRGVELDATDGYAHLRLGDAWQALGRTQAAEAAYREAARWSPELFRRHPAVADTRAETR